MLHYSFEVGIFLSSLATYSTQRSTFYRDNELDFAESCYIFIFHVLFPVFSSIYGKTRCASLCTGNSLVLRRINYSQMLKLEVRSTLVIYVTKGENTVFTFRCLLHS